jgi:hypothetical protein
LREQLRTKSASLHMLLLAEIRKTNRSRFQKAYLAIIVSFLSPLGLWGQGEDRSPLYLQALSQDDVHHYLMDNWATVQLTVTNRSPSPRDGRVVVSYPGQPDIQYARDVWLPPRSTLSTWMIVGPCPKTGTPPNSYDLDVLLYNRISRQDRIVLPRLEERTRSRRLAYRPKERLTCIMLDDDCQRKEVDSAAPPPVENNEVAQLVRASRFSCNLSEHVQIVHGNLKPPVADAYVGVDHWVLAGHSLDIDSPGERTLGRWLLQGGKLWVMLDRTDPAQLARILPGRLGIQVVDRTSLTKVPVESVTPKAVNMEESEQDFEQPVDFVRVLLSPDYTVLHAVNGWPASFTRQVGRGKLLVTTLGARGWFRPRAVNDEPSPFSNFPDLPVPVAAMDALTQELQPPAEANPFAPGAFESLLTSEIGYEIIGVGTAATIFAGFVIVVLTFGVLLRRSHHFGLFCCLGPAAAAIATTAFLSLGETSRRALPPTVAVTELVDVVPGAQECSVTGLLGHYRPEGGPVSVSSQAGGLLDLDMSGLEGQTRRFVMSDIDCWHWENLAFPPGLRLTPFKCTVALEKPVSAVARFGANGLEGELHPGTFEALADAVIRTTKGRLLPVVLGPDNTFTAEVGNPLGGEQYLAESLLTDRQQHRRTIYRQLSADASFYKGRNCLLFWADPIEVPFNIKPATRKTGSALITVPLDFEPTPLGSDVVVPGDFVTFRRILNGMPRDPPLEGKAPLEMLLRFQLPPTVLPMKVARARLFAAITAPDRVLTLAGRSSDGLVKVLTVESPIEPVRLDITRDDLLESDNQGGLYLHIAFSDQLRRKDQGEFLWNIKSLALEVTGKTLSRK